MNVQPTILEQRNVFYRERAAGMYAAFPFALADIAVEIPCLILQAAIYSILTFFMVRK